MATEGVVWRWDRYESILPHVDLKRRTHLHPFQPIVLMRQAAALGIPLDKVPGAYWSLDVDDEGFSVAEVACPCGETPRVDAGGLHACECERGYFFTGEDVWVVNSQKSHGTAKL